jgi:23S rRNA (cytosine1962-C5)-methyltransferase
MPRPASHPDPARPATAVIKPQRDKSLRNRHPWVFAGSVARTIGTAGPGDTVEVVGADGTWLGRGAMSPASQIRVRIWTFAPEEPVDAAYFQRRLARALEVRRPLRDDAAQDAWRVVHAESDGLPGVIVDRYADFLVCQFLTAGAERWKTTIVEALAGLLPCAGIYERSDTGVREKEGLPRTAGCLGGQAPPELVEIREGSLRYLVDVRNGHKTGFYLDQRDNRRRLAAYAPGAEVLNCFAYTGGFGVSAALAGAARVTNLEISVPSLELARRNFQLNGLDGPTVAYEAADVFKQLRAYRDADRAFDTIVLDPPKFVESRAQLNRACRGYKDINLLALKLLKPGGTLLTFSCSGLMEPALFQKIVADAAVDANRHVQILQRLDQAGDHPVSLAFPEGHYLKGLVCRAA